MFVIEVSKVPVRVRKTSTLALAVNVINVLSPLRYSGHKTHVIL